MPSKKKWLWVGIIIAVLNPVLSGLFLGAFFLSQPELRSAGKIVSLIAIIWGAFLFYLVSQNIPLKPFI